MENRKKLGIAFFILMILLIVFFGENSHGFVIGDFILIRMGIRVWSDGTSGLHYTGAVTAILLIIALGGVVMFSKDVHKNFGKFVLSFFIVGLFIYQPIYDSVYGFVKSNLNGLSSIEYIRDGSRLDFSSSNSTIELNGIIKLKNYSGETKKFYIKIPVEPDRNLYGDPKEIPVLNSNYEPTKFVIEPKREVKFEVKSYVKKDACINNYSRIMVPDIIIFDETEEKMFLTNTY